MMEQGVDASTATMHAQCRECLRGRETCRAQTEVEEQEAAAEVAPRVQRLEVLIRLRKLYRNLLRADGLLAQPSPIYQPYKRPGPAFVMCTDPRDCDQRSSHFVCTPRLRVHHDC